MLNFSCTREDLALGLQRAQKAVAKRTTMEILEGVKFETKDNNILTLMASDLEIGVKTVIPATVQGEGSLVLKSDFLYDLVRKLKDDEIIFKQETEGVIKMICGRSSYTLKGMSADDFPEFPKPRNAYNFTIASDTLSSIIKQTLYAVASSESIPILTGEKWEIHDHSLTAVGLDGYRLSIRLGQLSKPILEPLHIVVPGKALKELEKMLTNYDGDVTIQVSKSQIFFGLDDTIFASRLLEGSYIEYKKVIPKEKKTVINVNRLDLLNCAERSAIITKEKQHNLIVLSITDEELVIHSDSDLGHSHEVLPIQKWGSDLKIAFNVKFLLDALHACEDESIKIRFIDQVSPALFTNEDRTLVSLVLPVKLDSVESNY